MDATIRPYEPGDLATLQRLLQSQGIADQYDRYSGPGGAERLLEDPYAHVAGVRLAFVGSEPAAFACPIIPSGAPERWAALRGAVLPRFRRRGIGTALHHELVDWLCKQAPLHEQMMSAWQPDDAASAFAARLGYSHDRWMWLMERPRGGTPESVWPAGVRVRTLDGSAAMLAEWNDAYNDSFAEHYRHVTSPVEVVEALVRSPGFRMDGVLIAYRGDRVVGFCRNELMESRGEIAVLGTVRSARAIGLGRALLRWGVAWLERESALPVTLLVDGANESALALYRSEGFEVTRTRRIWTLRPAPA